MERHMRHEVIEIMQGCKHSVAYTSNPGLKCRNIVKKLSWPWLKNAMDTTNGMR